MTYYRLAEPNAAHEDFDGESVMLDLETGKYFSLSRSASFVVAAVLQGASLNEIAALCSGADNLDVKQIAGLLDQLAAFQLIEAVDLPFGNFNQSAFVSPPDEPLTVEMYDDLADLIIADPIHEVDEERGWPVRKADG